MQPVLTVEFSIKSGDTECKEESLSFNRPEEFFSYVAPGGGCEKIPSEVDAIQVVYLPPEHANHNNPIADLHVTLQVGIVFFNGPLAEVMQTMEAINDKAGRGELSQSFMSVIGAC